MEARLHFCKKTVNGKYSLPPIEPKPRLRARLKNHFTNKPPWGLFRGKRDCRIMPCFRSPLEIVFLQFFKI